MATSSSSMKGFYRQRKNNITGITKPSSSSSKSKKPSPRHSATVGSGITQPPALISHGSPDLQDDFDKNETLLRKFDMDMKYGPCIGMTRMARWERACRLGLNPPEEIGILLKSEKVQGESLWDGRI
ncbi:hypothetical protein Tsubulata_046206 [Turnera subulata]|uniref:DNA polymerase delta subunit 4 n=1 Tax=Turnera subulata TaxID=218843 RepID=A0A9Q0JCK9_9ROSI|nr:hypothetical protein Tsubulata_046206 [Turnera subulata]